MLDGLFSQSVCSFRIVGGQTLFLARNNGVANSTILKRKKKNYAAMATEQLIKKLKVYGIIIKTQSRCNGLYFTLLLLTINWFINIFLFEVYNAHTVITKMNSYILAFSYYDTLNRVLSGVNYINLAGLATHLFHSFETSTNCNTNNTLLDRPLSHRTHRNEIHCRPEKIFLFPAKQTG